MEVFVKNVFVLFVVLGFAGLAQAQNRQLSMTFDNQQAAELMPADGMSCHLTLNSASGDRFLPDVKANHFALANPSITFQSDTAEVAKVNSIVLQLNAPQLTGGGYRCEIMGDELAALFALAPDQRWNGEIAPGQTLTVNSACQSLKCGGVSLVNPTEAFKAVGSITINGQVATGITGEIFPLEAMDAFEIEQPAVAAPEEPAP
jgi:hypothetical protein